MKYTFLSKKFYEEHPTDKYPQMEQKEDRPYTHITLDIYGKTFALPLRSGIDHPHAFFTNRRNHCGVDYSKAIVIEDEAYIDNETRVHIRDDEYKKLLGKDFRIATQFFEYIELYKRAKTDKTIPHRDKIIAYSTLQYYENYIFNIDKETDK